MAWSYAFWALLFTAAYLALGLAYNVRFKDMPMEMESVPHIEPIRRLGIDISSLLHLPNLSPPPPSSPFSSPRWTTSFSSSSSSSTSSLSCSSPYILLLQHHPLLLFLLLLTL
jgi:hypothetical protein